MAITEDSRHQLYQRLEHVMGRPQATTLMEHLPPVGWADVATKRDLEHVHASIDHVREVLSLKIDAEVATLRGELADQRGELRSGLATLRAEMQGLRADFHREQRSLVLAVIAANATIAGLAVTAAAALR